MTTQTQTEQPEATAAPAAETTETPKPLTRAEKAAAKKAEKEAAAAAKLAETEAAKPIKESGRFAIEYAAASDPTKWLAYGVRSTAATGIGFVESAKSAVATRTWRIRDTKTNEVLYTKLATETAPVKAETATAAAA